MKALRGVGLLLLLLAGCAGTPPARESASEPVPAPIIGPATLSAQTARFDGPGHDYANAIHFRGINNPLAFSQKQQEWLWLNYRDWKKLGQAMREKNGVRYDEVTLVNARGDKRVLYFRMPTTTKP